MGTTLSQEEVEAYLAAKKPYSELLAKVVEEMYAKTEEERMAEHGLDVPPKHSHEDPSEPKASAPEPEATDSAAEASAESKVDVDEIAETMRKLRISAEKGKDKVQKEHWARIDELLGNRRKGR